MLRGTSVRRVQDDERFWSKVAKTESCWLWQGQTNENGYGRFYYAGRFVMAHRYAFGNPVAANLTLDHLCRVRHCVNPDHLEVVTSRQNTLRGIGPTAQNAAKTQCAQGHEYTLANTYRDPLGARHCRTCNRTRQSHIYRQHGRAKRNAREQHAKTLAQLREMQK